MLQQVLTVRRTILHLTDDAYQLRMQAVDTEVDGGTLTGLDDFVLQLLLHLGHHLFNTCRMDTTVAHQLVQGQTAGLAAYGIEC